MKRRQHRSEIKKLLDVSEPALTSAVLEVVDDLITVKRSAINNLTILRKRQRNLIQAGSTPNPVPLSKYVMERLSALKDDRAVHVYINTNTNRASVLRKPKEEDHLVWVGNYSPPFDSSAVLEDLELSVNELTSLGT